MAMMLRGVAEFFMCIRLPKKSSELPGLNGPNQVIIDRFLAWAKVAPRTDSRALCAVNKKDKSTTLGRSPQGKIEESRGNRAKSVEI
ncbi:hypothetical protein FLX56_17770 [Synechococcus moorigangaii CMS01]|nr:hypothetical protein [Synechococcus moorigangaii CMS01]